MAEGQNKMDPRPSVAPRKTSIEEPELSLAKKYVDFEGNAINFDIKYPKHCLALATNVHIGNTTFSDLNDFERSARGRIRLVIQAILDSSMSGPVSAYVSYFDVNRTIRHSKLTAEVLVIPRQKVDKNSVEFKGRIRASVSSLNVTDKIQHNTLPRSDTTEELKNSERYRSYQNRLKKDGIFVRPRIADVRITSSFIIPTIEVCPDVHDFCAPVDFCETNGLVSHLNGVAVHGRRKSRSLNGTPHHSNMENKPVHEEHLIFIKCSENYKSAPSESETAEPVPVIELLREHILRRSCSETCLSSATRSSDYCQSATSGKFCLKMNFTKYDILARMSGRTQEWFCTTVRWWYRIKHEYRVVSDGIQRMNRENR